jgi:hypothetical protein
MWVVGKLARIGRDIVYRAHRRCASPRASSDYQLSADSALGDFCRVAAPFVVIAVLSRLVTVEREMSERHRGQQGLSSREKNASRRFTAAR